MSAPSRHVPLGPALRERDGDVGSAPGAGRPRQAGSGSTTDRIPSTGRRSHPPCRGSPGSGRCSGAYGSMSPVPRQAAAVRTEEQTRRVDRTARSPSCKSVSLRIPAPRPALWNDPTESRRRGEGRCSARWRAPESSLRTARAWKPASGRQSGEEVLRDLVHAFENDSDTAWLFAIFTDRESYYRNDDPAQNERHLEYRRCSRKTLSGTTARSSRT